MFRLRLTSVVFIAIVCAAMVCGCAGTASPGNGTSALPTSVPGGNLGGTVGTVSSPGTGQSESATEEVPAYLACDPATLPFALPADATRCQHVDIITTYFTKMTADEVIQFYVDGLAGVGWQRTDSGSIPGTGQWAKGAAELNVFAGPQEGMTAVQVQEVTAP